MFGSTSLAILSDILKAYLLQMETQIRKECPHEAHSQARRASLSVRIFLRYEVEKGLRAVYADYD